MKYAILSKGALVVLACLLAACNTVLLTSTFNDDDPLFLVQKPVDGERMVMEALYEGSVVEVEGCLRLGDEPDSHTVVWPPAFSLSTQDDAQVVLDDEGHAVGRIGDFFRLGGGEVPTLWENGLVDEVARTAALDQCPGRYWLVGDVLQR
ncbi:MAG TPA: hypothetical protein VKP65_08160 [Rhodothermales bacterium]|nr:hypothetical protein [Rhodothermales bacterium]